MAHAPPRRLSRWMPPLPDRTLSPRAFGVGCAVFATFVGVLVYRHPPFGVVAVGVVLFFAVLTLLRRRRDRRMAAERAGESICTFARALDRRAVDPWVIRAVYDALGAYADFPIRASDSLDTILGVYGDELDEVARDIAERTGRTLDGAERNPVRVRTAGDLVRFFSHQPRVAA
jgi:hypothetical protein